MYTNAPSILHSLVAAVCPIDGIAVGDWSDKATWRIDFGSAATPAQQSAAQTVITNFDPTGAQITAQAVFDAALALGLTITWTASTALDDTYPIDDTTQIRMLAERLSVAVNNTFTNGKTSLTWYGITGTAHTMSMSQAGLFIKAVWKYLSQLLIARATAAAGGTPIWPSANVSITG